MFAFAGLWETWKDREAPDADLVRTFTILTTTPNELVETIHDRMPVILDEEAQQVWLNHTSEETGHLSGLLKSFPAASMTAYDVPTSVHNGRHGGPGLVFPV